MYVCNFHITLPTQSASVFFFFIFILMISLLTYEKYIRICTVICVFVCLQIPIISITISRIVSWSHLVLIHILYIYCTYIYTYACLWTLMQMFEVGKQNIYHIDLTLYIKVPGKNISSFNMKYYRRFLNAKSQFRLLV